MFLMSAHSYHFSYICYTILNEPVQKACFNQLFIPTLNEGCPVLPTKSNKLTSSVLKLYVSTKG